MKKICSFIMMFIVMCYILLESTYALDSSKSTKNCKFNASTTDTLNVFFATNPDNLSNSKRGRLYTFNSNGNTLFCLIPNVFPARYYDMNETPISTSGLEEYYYRVYGWLMDGGITEYKQRWAQVAMWYIAYCVQNNKTPSATELGVAFTTQEMSLDCYRYENDIRLYLNNPHFSCNSYFDPYSENTFVDYRGGEASVWGYGKYFDIFYNDTKYADCDENELKYYAHYYFSVPASSLDAWYNQRKNEPIIKRCNNGVYYSDGVAYAARCSASYQYSEMINGNGQFALRILQHDRYGGELYYWYPHGRKSSCIDGSGKMKKNSDGKYSCSNQVLIGIYGCDHGDPTCQDGLDKIVENNKPNLTSSNANYISQLTAYQQQHQLEIKPEYLENASWLANPKCDGGTTEGGFSCIDDLNKLKNELTPGTTQYDAQHQLMKDRTAEGKYDDGIYNGDYYNPGCNSTPPDTPKCEAEFNYDQCDNFEDINGGFRISDNLTDECWKYGNKAFEANTVSKESKWNEASNSYCNVYCWEAAGADFPGAIKDIEAGQRFFWGRGTEDDGYFGNINASRTCYTTNINYQQYYNDVVANEAAISSAYNQWLAEKKFNEQTVKTGSSCTLDDGCRTTTTVGEGCGGWNETTDGKCVNFDGLADSNGHCANGTPTSVNIVGYGPATICLIDYKPRTGGYSVCATCNEGSPDGSGHCHKSGTNYYREELTTNGIKIDKKEKCFANGTDATTISNDLKVSNGDALLKSKLEERTKIQAEINNCQSSGYIQYNESSKTMYTYNTTVKLSYGEKFWNGGASVTSPRTISADDLLVQNGQVYTFNNGGNRGAISVQTAGGLQTGVENVVNICTDVSEYTSNKYGCNDSNLYVLPVYSDYTWSFAGYWKYYYNNQYFVWHFIKQSGTAKVTSQISVTDFTFGGKYGFIASFNMVTNFYSYATVEVKNFGNNGHFNELYQELSVDYIPDGTSSDTYTYYCPFHIYNKMYGTECYYDCDFETKKCALKAESPAYCKTGVGGIDVVYRIIELTSPEQAAAGNKEIVFPGIVGTGRKLGANWEDFYTNNREKYNKITTYSNIYDGGPIYEIDLTPAAIQAIRADNKLYREKNKDPYTSMKDPDGNQKYKCTGNTPQEQTCVSTWISDLKDGKVGDTDIGVKLTGEYGELGTDARLAAIKRAKESKEASGTKNLTSTGGV